MKFDLVIKNGTLITPDSTVEADIGVAGEEIAAIGRGLSGRREIDASGCLVTPGAIDAHVHLQMPKIWPRAAPNRAGIRAVALP